MISVEFLSLKVILGKGHGFNPPNGGIVTHARCAAATMHPVTLGFSEVRLVIFL